MKHIHFKKKTTMQNKTVFFDKFGTAAELYVKEIPPATY